MKLILALVAALSLAACGASPKTASITDGKVSGISSSDAVTLIKQDVRKAKVADVQANAKPIFILEAKDGETIMLGGVQRLEINVPMDENVLLAETPDAVSEKVQMTREWRQGLRDVGVPLGLGLLYSKDRKRQSNNALEASRINATTEQQRNQSFSDLANRGIEAASEPTVILQVPMGSSVLPME